MLRRIRRIAYISREVCCGFWPSVATRCLSREFGNEGHEHDARPDGVGRMMAVGLAKTASGCFRPRFARIGAARRPKPAAAGLSSLERSAKPAKWSSGPFRATTGFLSSAMRANKKAPRGGLFIGGQGGIRTHGTLAGSPHFECGAIDHSTTCPPAVIKKPGDQGKSFCAFVKIVISWIKRPVSSAARHGARRSALKTVHRTVLLGLGKPRLTPPTGQIWKRPAKASRSLA